MNDERKMRRFIFGLAVAAVTFSLGVLAFTVLYFGGRGVGESQPSQVTKPAVEINVPETAVYDPCSLPQPEGREITGEEAVQLAECFIVQNGYTDLPPIGDASKLTPEAVFPGTDDMGMRMRHDSLERRAYGVMSGRRRGDGWTVAFRYRNKPEFVRFYGERLGTVGRAVTMDARGGRMRVEHADFILSAIRKSGDGKQ